MAGAPKGAGRKLRVSILPQASVLPLLPRSEGGVRASPLRGGLQRFPASPSLLSIPGTPDRRGSGRDVPNPVTPSSLPALVLSEAGCAGVPGGRGSATPAPHRGRRSGGNRVEEPGGLLPGGLLSRATLLPRGSWGNGRWRRRPGAGFRATLGQNPPADRRRRPRRAVLCPCRSRRGWQGPEASTTLRAPLEERPPEPAPRSPQLLPQRGRERIRLTAKRSKRDPRN